MLARTIPKSEQKPKSVRELGKREENKRRYSKLDLDNWSFTRIYGPKTPENLKVDFRWQEFSES